MNIPSISNHSHLISIILTSFLFVWINNVWCNNLLTYTGEIILILPVHVRWEKNMSSSPFSPNAFPDFNEAVFGICMKDICTVCKTNGCSWNGYFTCPSSTNTFMAPITTISVSHTQLLCEISRSPSASHPCALHSKLHCSPMLFILSHGEAELEANWQFYLVESCAVYIESSHINPGCSQNDQKLMCLMWNGVELLLGHDHVLRREVHWWKQYLKVDKKACCDVLYILTVLCLRTMYHNQFAEIKDTEIWLILFLNSSVLIVPWGKESQITKRSAESLSGTNSPSSNCNLSSNYLPCICCNS